MVEAIQNFVGPHFPFYVAGTAFLSGSCLLYLVISRTLRKRSGESQAATEAQN